MSETKKKAGVLSVGVTVVSTGAANLADGRLYVGGALFVAGLVLFGLYEVYQLRQLPEGLTEDDVRAIAEEIGVTVENAAEDTEVQE